MTWILKLLFIGVSLQSYYFYNLHMPLISIVSLLLMGFILLATSLRNGIRFPKDATIGIALGYMLIFFWSLMGILFYGDIVDTKRILAFPLLILCVLVAITLYVRCPLESLVRLYLLVHITFFYLQFSTYYLTGYTIDFLAPVTGEEQRMFGGTFTIPDINKFMRPTGLFNEPGTYATYVAPFVALFGRWYSKSGGNKLVFLFSFFSIILSFSTFGFIFGVLIILFTKNIFWLKRVYMFIASTAIAGPYLYDRFIFRPSIDLNSGIEIRQVYIENSLSFLLTNPITIMFGAGLLTLDPRVELGMAVNDSTLILYFLHFTGFPLTIIFGCALIYVFMKFDRASRIALLIVLLSKHSIFSPFFPFILAAIFWKNRVANSSSA